MRNERRLLDRLFQMGTPRVVDGFRPPPTHLADGVWSLERHLRMPGGPILPARTAIVRHDGDGLMLISPPPPHEETFAAIDALGAVQAVLAPNAFHYLYIAAALQRYPQAELCLAPGLQARVRGLPFGKDITASAIGSGCDYVVLDSGRGISEVVLFHRASRILFLTDCAFNLVHIERVAERLFWRLFGVPPEFGPSRTARMMLLSSREPARTALRSVLRWPFERIHVAHGEVVQTEARARFERAFSRYL
jgi:hypothetical protein